MNQENSDKDNNQESMDRIQKEVFKDPESEESKEAIINSEQVAKWVNNQGEEVAQVFGFNENAELVNGRAAMFGCVIIGLAAITTKTSLLENIQQLDLQSIWLSIGVYAG